MLEPWAIGALIVFLILFVILLIILVDRIVQDLR